MISGFQLYDILEETKLQRQYKDHWLPGRRGKREVNRWNTGFLGQCIYSVLYYNGE